jgi:electron transfer flavoprotein alpha subunit
MSSALVIIELVEGRPPTASLEMLALARTLIGNGTLAALAPGTDEAMVQTLIARGADKVYVANDPAACDYNSDSWVSCAERIARKRNPAVILAVHNSTGADFAPRLALRLGDLGYGCATGCVAIENCDGTLHFTRPCYGGNARETVSFKSGTVVATVRAGIYDALPVDTARHGEIITVDLPPSRVRVIERKRDSGGAQRLEDAKVIVAGGRGLNGPEGFKVLEPLATALGGLVGASRVPCDLGWCSHAMQIGLTGKTVTPELYIAVGISGASHHLAGCGNAKTIVAINTDPEAAIFRDAKFGVVGDFARVVPALTAAVKALPPIA